MIFKQLFLIKSSDSGSDYLSFTQRVIVSFCQLISELFYLSQSMLKIMSYLIKGTDITETEVSLKLDKFRETVIM